MQENYLRIRESQMAGRSLEMLLHGLDFHIPEVYRYPAVFSLQADVTLGG